MHFLWRPQVRTCRLPLLIGFLLDVVPINRDAQPKGLISGYLPHKYWVELTMETRENWARLRYRLMVGGNKGFDTADFVAECRHMQVPPHVAQNHKRSGASAIDLPILRTHQRAVRQPAKCG